VPCQFRQVVACCSNYRAGLALTLAHFFRPKVTLNYPTKGPLSPRRGGTRAAPLLPMARNAASPASCVEAVRLALAITIEAELRDDGSRRMTRYDIDMTHSLRPVPGSPPGRCYRRTPSQISNSPPKPAKN
jgi:formate hydrogenlyase subunit 6/NADH:ubiquinone oxidoreductase subunit I